MEAKTAVFDFSLQGHQFAFKATEGEDPGMPTDTAQCRQMPLVDDDGNA